MDATLRREIESLRKLKTKELKARYRKLFQEDSPSSNQQHLFRRIAWRLQSLAEGDLSERTRQRATDLAQDVELRLRAPGGFWKELERAQVDKRDTRLPVAGTILKRDYRGATLNVTVAEDGFLYNGRTYRSLSAVAQHVTGTRWNGFAFFALNRQTAMPEEPR
jgi:hypothetical protein